MARLINIALDGYAGVGKSTTAKQVAQRLGYTYLDSGAMYRAVTLALLQAGLPAQEGAHLDELLDTLDLSWNAEGELCRGGKPLGEALRTPPVNDNVSAVAALPPVRHAMVRLQQHRARARGVVMDGRDIGTVVLPDAELKVFMVADLDQRVQRRLAESQHLGLDEQKVAENLTKRDQIDSSRNHSPLKRAEDAILLDTTHLTISQQVDRVVELAQDIIVDNGKYES